MLRRIAALTMTAAAACSSARSVDPPSGAGSLAPRFSTSGDRIVLSWVEPDAAGVPALRFAERIGNAWSAPKTAARNALLSVDSADIPSVVPLSGDSLAAYWTVKRDASRDARDLFVATSRDDGSSWSSPVRPHRDDTEVQHGMATLIPTGESGGFGICWLDGRSGALSEYGQGGTSLYWADWRGDGFGPDVLLDPRVCDCCKTSGTRGPRGPLLAYRDRSDTERRDISTVRRDGDAWSAPHPVRADGWSLSACPTNGPSIAADGDLAAIAWFTGADATPSVWAALSSDGGNTFAGALRIDGGSPVGRVETITLPDGSIAVSWLERKGESAEVRVRRVASDGSLGRPVVVATTSPARASGYPTIAANGARDVLIAWREIGASGRVRAAMATLP